MVSLTGISATGATGEEIIYSLIIPNQTANWVETALKKENNMASTFVNNLRLEEMAAGEQSGQWGTKTNTNLELIGEALGFGTVNLATNADATETVADASSDAGRALFIKLQVLWIQIVQ